ncbi:MAG TPA: hypothetical protein PK874_00180 [Desulfobacteraceae bacterium]|nr:hypothetical protein [Desulfobacteraceae bacterium]HPJ66832.1 hypothetical protein [Desulfobacteraceae bacterium]
MNYHDAEQRGILKSIERPKGRGYLYAVFMAGLPASLCGGLVCPLSAFYQPFTSLWLVGWLAGRLNPHTPGGLNISSSRSKYKYTARSNINSFF